MSPPNDKDPTELHDHATLAPDHVRYPAVPLAFQTSPFVPARDLPPQAPEPIELPAIADAAPPDEPWGLLDLVEPPATYGIDEVMCLARDPHTLFAWWEATPAGLAAARAALVAEGALVLRLQIVGGAAVDVLLETEHGRRYLGAPRSGVSIAATLGLRSGDGRFAPIARAPRVLVPYADAAPESPVEWMEVAPARTGGARLEPPDILREGPAHAVPGAGTVNLGDDAPGTGRAPSSSAPSSPVKP